MQQVLDRFHADLQAVHDGVTLLNQYKKLHELVARLQVKLPQQLEDAAEEAAQARRAGPLDIYAYQLRQNARQRLAPRPRRCRPKRSNSPGRRPSIASQTSLSRAIGKT